MEKLDYDEKKAYVREVDVDYFTDANYVGDNVNKSTGLPRNYGMTAAFRF